MELAVPCNSCNWIHRKPDFYRKTMPLKSRTFPFNASKCRRKTTSELQSTVGVTGSAGGSYSPANTIPTHKVTVHDRQRGVVHEFLVPEDQYILHTAEAQNISLPFACRHGPPYDTNASLAIFPFLIIVFEKSSSLAGCCTSCAVRVKSGQLRQPEALGISAELKEKACGYALLCVGFPSSDLEVETQDEDEVYWLQFGRYFARGPIDRDDYALELAMADE
ncbi:hypothetical protein L484_023282 [Morus notabilis]|uniref:2Fe-2S ferredoxin-type domain-containing protein n=1 Tax=Morus notabilis TaxID=981085 RepID=W9SCS6_9ROSA|nr:hypothetical protein L484_023282 [Morus notabilis]